MTAIREREDMVRVGAESDRPKQSLPRRDLIVLPLLVLATLLVLFVPAELASRTMYPDEQVDACLTPRSAGPFHGLPGCTTRTRTPEGPWAVISYNSCGYRNPEPCGPKPEGTLRVAVIGASTGAGFLTPYEDTMAARASATLTRVCGRPVEFQNLAAAGNYGTKLIASAAEAMTLSPDALVMAVSPIDFEKADNALAASEHAPPPGGPLAFMDRLRDTVSSSRLLYMEAYFILRNDDTYVPMFVDSGHKADFMRAPLPAIWVKRLQEFDSLIGQIAATSATRGVPGLVMFEPQRAQAALAASPRFGHDLDPEELPEAIRRIVERHGMIFVDVTRAIPRGTQTKTLYYAINGHPNGTGHALMADTLVRRLVAPDLPVFAEACHLG